MTATPTQVQKLILSTSTVGAGRFFYFVPGIFTPPEDARTWDYQAQDWMHERGFGLAAGFNYYSDALGGVLARDHYADLVAADLLCAIAAGYDVTVSAHSNGNDIVAHALARH